MFWNLKKRINDLYGTQSDFADVAEIHESYVSQVVRGRRELQTPEKKRWAVLLRCKAEELFTKNVPKDKWANTLGCQENEHFNLKR